LAIYGSFGLNLKLVLYCKISQPKVLGSLIRHTSCKTLCEVSSDRKQKIKKIKEKMRNQAQQKMFILS
jgi:hypothetical protein